MEFLRAIKSDTEPQIRIVGINDGVGNIMEIDCNCIVVSEETYPNALYLKDLYAKVKRKNLAIELIALDKAKFGSVSSTSIREDMIGRFLKKRNYKQNNLPIIIGITGLACSGKSFICNYIKVIYIFI